MAISSTFWLQVLPVNSKSLPDSTTQPFVSLTLLFLITPEAPALMYAGWRTFPIVLLVIEIFEYDETPNARTTLLSPIFQVDLSVRPSTVTSAD